MIRTIIGLILAAVIIFVGYTHISNRLSRYLDNGATWPIDLDEENYISKDFRADDFLNDMAKDYVDSLYENLDDPEATVDASSADTETLTEE